MAGSRLPSAPPSHEDTPPPLYSEVVTESPRVRDKSNRSYKTPVLCSGIILALVFVIILGFVVAHLWVQLDTLQV